jgi:hypothetical protein
MSNPRVGSLAAPQLTCSCEQSFRPTYRIDCTSCADGLEESHLGHRHHLAPSGSFLRVHVSVAVAVLLYSRLWRSIPDNQMHLSVDLWRRRKFRVRFRLPLSLHPHNSNDGPVIGRQAYDGDVSIIPVRTKKKMCRGTLHALLPASSLRQLQLTFFWAAECHPVS